MYCFILYLNCKKYNKNYFETILILNCSDYLCCINVNFRFKPQLFISKDSPSFLKLSLPRHFNLDGILNLE